ncbi:MAG: glycosyltransferase family 1 protein [Actinomycetota bacterium]
MRIVVVAETFLPEMNGVTNSVLRVVEHLDRRGHDVMVIAPGSGPGRVGRVPVERVPGVALPRYSSISVGVPGRRLRQLIKGFAPDVVHVAAPAVLGAAAVFIARDAGIPAVTIYQTDLAGFARRYHLPIASAPLWRWLRHVHNAAAVTLVPSSTCAWDLRRNGIERVHLWARGVDTERFSPERRCEAWRRQVSPRGRPIVGYSGRLAVEKGLHRLAPLAARRDLQLVLVGDGPTRRRLTRTLRGARFVGFLDGTDLARAVASFDVFVHPGIDETFCQAIQEALASGVPVVGPAAGGPLDLIRHGENGFFWLPEEDDTIVTAVDSVLGDDDLRHRLGRAAQESVRHRTWERIGDDLLGHYVRSLPVPTRRLATA